MSEYDQTSIRLQLLRLGYSPLPNLYKRPVPKDWNKQDFVKRELNEQRIRSWERRYPEARSTGVMVENGICAFDGDVDDPLIYEVLKLLPGDVEAAAPTRFGGGQHKLMLFFRCSDVTLEQTRRPLVSRKYHRPGDDDDKVQKIEAFLSSAGDREYRRQHELPACQRQCAVYGPHSAERNYSWDENTLLPLHLMAPDDLPAMSYAQVCTLIDAFERLAEAAGWERIEAPAAPASDNYVFCLESDTLFETERDGTLTWQQLDDAGTEWGDDVCCPGRCIPGNAGSNVERCRFGRVAKHGNALGVYDFEQGIYFLPKALQVDMERFAAQLTEAKQEQAEMLAEEGAGVSLFSSAPVAVEEFYALVEERKYIWTPNGKLWPALSINSLLGQIGGISAARWLDTHRIAHAMTWAPGEDVVIRNRLFDDGGWIDRPGTVVFNLYRPPRFHRNGQANVSIWRDHLRRLYPEEWQHIELWMAQRVQRPGEKINHALVLGGGQGIGKDTLLEPLKLAVGDWNFKEVAPSTLFGQFNEYMRAVVLRISEARDLGDTNRYAFYDHTKAVIAAPPDTVRINEKHRNPYTIPNVIGVIITMNEQGSLYLPSDDRRHYVAWSTVSKEEVADTFAVIWRWYLNGGGLAAVANHLMTLPLDQFDPKAPPPRTQGFVEVASAGQPPEEAELRNVLEILGHPIVVTADEIAAAAGGHVELSAMLRNPSTRQRIKHRLKACGYSQVRNPDDRTDGRWKLYGQQRVVIYGRDDHPQAERMRAAQSKRASPPSAGLPTP